MRAACFALGSLLILACSDGPKAPPPPATAPATQPATISVSEFGEAAQKALEPFTHGMVFKAIKVDKDRVITLKPEGWVESDVLPGDFKPADSERFGAATRFSVGSTCAGACAPKQDWKTRATRHFAQFEDAERFDTIEARALTKPEGQLLIAKSKATPAKTIHVAVARWKEGASRYLFCRATLESEEAQGQTNAFAKVCELSQASFLK